MSFNTEKVAHIAASLDAFDTDCAITVALKITDDTCKMEAEQRALFMALYDALPAKTSVFFDANVFDLIAAGRTAPSPEIFAAVKPLREAAMEMITRPKMKAFKASIRKKMIV
jgi:hypothetical protein